MSTTSALDLSHMHAGFADPVHDSQQCFRSVLQALAQPGRLFELDFKLEPPAGLSAAQCAMLLCLADFDTGVHLFGSTATTAAEQYLRFHTACPLSATLGRAHFVTVRGLESCPPLADLMPGEAAYPDRSASLLIEVSELAEGGPISLRGPGIRHTQAISVGGWQAATTAFFAANRALFPLGVDVILSCKRQIMGLPRTTIVEV